MVRCHRIHRHATRRGRGLTSQAVAAYWLFKSEPDVFSYDHLVRNKREGWDGVRNYQARNFMRAMKVGDKGIFYHSNARHGPADPEARRG